MNSYDGPTLRAIRESIGIPLRRIARTAGMSHGHLSKVERGEHGRPVTPAIIAAYERITGVTLADAAAKVAETRERQTGRRGVEWTPGTLTDMRRKGYNAAVGALTVGGPLGEPVTRLIDSTGRPVVPVPPDESDLVQLEQVTDLLTTLDLRFGGGLVSQLSKTVLRWAAPMLDLTGTSDEVHRRLYSAIGGLAHRAAWAAFDVSAHEAARSLFRLALHAAALGEDHNLRGHVVADVAAQHNQLGYHRDALDLVRLVEGDDRVSPAVRMVLHGVKARTYGALGESDACRKQIEAAEHAFGRSCQQEPGWVGRLANPAKLSAATGHALAELALRTGDEADRSDASQRLTVAIDQFDTSLHARAHALCVLRLALLHGKAESATDPPLKEGLRSGQVELGIAAMDQLASDDPR